MCATRRTMSGTHVRKMSSPEDFVLLGAETWTRHSVFLCAIPVLFNLMKSGSEFVLRILLVNSGLAH